MPDPHYLNPSEFIWTHLNPSELQKILAENSRGDASLLSAQCSIHLHPPAPETTSTVLTQHSVWNAKPLLNPTSGPNHCWTDQPWRWSQTERSQILDSNRRILNAVKTFCKGSMSTNIQCKEDGGDGHEQNVNAIVEKLLQQKVLQHRKRRTSQKALSYFYKKGKIQALSVGPVWNIYD